METLTVKTQDTDQRRSPYGGHVRANGIRQHYLHYPGEGKNVLIVPGIVSPAALWAHIALPLSDEGYDVRILDVRGRGLSEQGSHLDYGLEACTEDLLAFIATLGSTPPVVIGHSMGARIGARAAARSSAIYHLIMLDPPASAPGSRPYPIPADRTRMLVEAAHRGEAEAYLRQPGIARWPDPLLKQRAQWLASCDPRVIEAAYLDFHAQDIYADVARIRCPATLVISTASGVINAEEAARFRRSQPALRILSAPGAAHQLQAENTDLCLEILRQILREGAQETS